MQNLKYTDVLNILRRVDQQTYRDIADFITYENHCEKVRGWQRAIDDAKLFQHQFMHLPPLANAETEPKIWKYVYESDNLYGSYLKNYIAYKRIIEKEKYIQHTLDLCINSFGYIQPQITNAIRDFKTPNFIGITQLDELLQTARINGVDVPYLLDCFITLHDWPNCFNTGFSNSKTPFNETNFWYLVNEQLSTYIPNNDTTKISLRNFLVKYYTKFDWKKNTQLYACIDEEFILAHPEIPYFWTTVLCHIKLSEPLLTEIMQFADAGKQFKNQTPNIAYLAEKQVLSEEFVEKWFVSGFSETKTPTEIKRRYDQDHIWDQLLRHQNLSEEFRAKYNYKRSKPATHTLRSIIQARAIAEQAPPKEDEAFSSNIQSLKDYLKN